MNTGFFCTIESIDGVGKSTQMAMLGAYLTKLGQDVRYTKEPGDAFLGSNVGKGIRRLLFTDPTTKAMHPGVADCLFLADHIQNAGDVARLRSEGKVIISDRYADSQFAYAASATKQCPAWALKAYRDNYGIEPDLTVLLVARGEIGAIMDADIQHGVSTHREDISWALKRAQARRGVEEGKQNGKRWNDVEEQRRIQDAYMAQIGSLPRTQVINVWEGDEALFIHNQIVECVLQRMIGDSAQIAA